MALQHLFIRGWKQLSAYIYLTVAGIFSACDQINFRANECRAKLV